MMKRTTKNSLVAAISILAISLVICGFSSVTVRATIQPAVSMWVDPPTVNVTTAGYDIGDRFNVTVWVNTQVNASYVGIYSWNSKMLFNGSLLNATRVGYTNGTTSNFFYGHGTVAVPSVIQVGSVLFGESLLGEDIRTPGNGSLYYVEFLILAAPTGNATLTSLLNISASNNYLLDSDLDEVAPTRYNGVFNFAVAPPDTISPTISDLTQSPSGSQVPANTTVTVSANVTDNVGGSGVANATLWYSTDNVTFASGPMVLSLGLWTGTIPGQVNGTTVYYKISASDIAGNTAFNDNNSVNYTYYVFPEFTAIFLLMILAALTAAMLFCRRKAAKLL